MICYQFIGWTWIETLKLDKWFEFIFKYINKGKHLITYVETCQMERYLSNVLHSDSALFLAQILFIHSQKYNIEILI